MYLKVTYESHNGEKEFAGDRVVSQMRDVLAGQLVG